MSKRTDRSHRQIALAAFRLWKKGYSNGEIAFQTGLERKKISEMIKLGERLTTLPEFEHHKDALP